MNIGSCSRLRKESKSPPDDLLNNLNSYYNPEI